MRLHLTCSHSGSGALAEFFNVLPPEAALAALLKHVRPALQTESLKTHLALDRVAAAAVRSPSALPAFPRATMDGYALRAMDSFGASAGLPAYLTLVGEVPMGRAVQITVGPGEAAIVHTGGMIPDGTDAVVMIENTQVSREGEIEVVKAVAVGENVLKIGEDVRAGDQVLPAGHWLRPQDVGGLQALGITEIQVVKRPRVAILATGDEVVPPDQPAGPGQVRDINSYTVDGLVRRSGGEPVHCGIIRDNFEALSAATRSALIENDALVLSAGSSVSVRDLTSRVIDGLGEPGILVHGVAVKPGKPTILAAAQGKPILGLPGNPVSAMIIADLFLTPALYHLMGCTNPPRRGWLRARLARNLDSEAGREDYVPARLEERDGDLWAEPVFGKSNLIFTLVHAHGVIKIPMNASGIAEGEWVDVRL